MNSSTAIKAFCILVVLLALVGLAAYFYDNMKFFEDGSITLFDTQVACRSGWLCDDGSYKDLRHRNDYGD